MRSIRQAYREFLNTSQGTEVYRCFKRILYSERDSLVTALARHVLPCLPALRKEHVRVCDIGGGDGARIARIVALLHEAFGNVFDLDFVEQSRLYATEFAQRAKPPSLRVRVHDRLFEDAALPSASFDVVFLIHSIFAFANGSAVEKVLRLPQRGGSVIVVSNATDSFLAGLKHLVDADFADARYEITDLGQSLEARGVAFSTRRFDTEWEITDVAWQAATATVLDWISLGRYASFPDRKKAEIDEYLRHQSTRTPTARLFRETEVVLVIPPIT